MKKITLIAALFLVTFVLLIGITSYSQNSPTKSKELANLDEFILEQMEISNVPGMSACIIVGDSLVWDNNYGYADLELNKPVTDSTLFAVLSIGKSVSAVSFMQRWENGGMGLDQDVNDVLPFNVQNPWVTQNTITPRMLMCHSSSLSDYHFDDYVTIGDAGVELGGFLQNYLAPGTYYSNDNYYNQIPGTQYHYSNIGPGLTGYIVETLSGIGFSDYVKDSLFTPMDMSRSAWFLADIDTNNLARGYEYVSGSFQPWPYLGHPAYPGIMLRSTARELSNYIIMYLNNGNYKGIQILERESVDSMTTVQNPAWLGSYGSPGLGLYYRDDFGNRTVWGHNGGSVTGYAAQLYFCRDENTGIVLTTNSNQYVDAIVERMFEYAAMIIIPEEAIDINEYGFTARWNSAPSANEYYFSLYDDSFPPDTVPGYVDLNVGTDTSIVVTGLEPGKEYLYKIRGHNGDEFGPYSGIIKTFTDSLGTSILDIGIELRINVYPNPANANATVEVELQHENELSLSLYDLNGREVMMEYTSIMNGGKQIFNLDCSHLSGGIYLIKLQSGKGVASKKLIIQ